MVAHTKSNRLFLLIPDDMDSIKICQRVSVFMPSHLLKSFSFNRVPCCIALPRYHSKVNLDMEICSLSLFLLVVLLKVHIRSLNKVFNRV